MPLLPLATKWIVDSGSEAVRWVTGAPPLAFDRWLGSPYSRASIVARPRETCASDDRIAWHWWRDAHAVASSRCRPGHVLGWTPSSGGTYILSDVYLEALANFTREQAFDNWTCDIGDVAGLANSKSPLCEYASLDRMIEIRRPEMVSQEDPAAIYHLLTHDELRILHMESRGDYFSLDSWDGRIFLSNSGGSHHFSAARYLTDRCDVKVPLQGRIYCRWIDEHAVESLVSDYTIFAIDGAPGVRNEFHDALQAYRAPYLLQRLPKGFSTRSVDEGGAYAVFLPRSNARSSRVADAMEKAGFCNVGTHLKDLVRRQVRPGEWRMPVDRVID